MSDTLLSDLPEIMAAAIKLNMPELRECAGISGPFDLARLKGTQIKAPAVMVSLLRARPGAGRTGPQPSFVLECAAYVVTTDRTGLDRDAAALNIAQHLMMWLPNRRWGQNCLGEAENVTMQSLVNKAVIASRASLLAVTWSQPAVVEPLPAVAPMPIALYVGGAPLTGDQP